MSLVQVGDRIINTGQVTQVQFWPANPETATTHASDAMLHVTLTSTHQVDDNVSTSEMVILKGVDAEWLWKAMCGLCALQKGKP